MFFVSLLFCLSISSLFCYHVWLVAHNRQAQCNVPFDHEITIIYFF